MDFLAQHYAALCGDDDLYDEDNNLMSPVSVHQEGPPSEPSPPKRQSFHAKGGYASRIEATQKHSERKPERRTSGKTHSGRRQSQPAGQKLRSRVAELENEVSSLNDLLDDKSAELDASQTLVAELRQALRTCQDEMEKMQKASSQSVSIEKLKELTNQIIAGEENRANLVLMNSKLQQRVADLDGELQRRSSSITNESGEEITVEGLQAQLEELMQSKESVEVELETLAARCDEENQIWKENFVILCRQLENLHHDSVDIREWLVEELNSANSQIQQQPAPVQVQQQDSEQQQQQVPQTAQQRAETVPVRSPAQQGRRPAPEMVVQSPVLDPRAPATFPQAPEVFLEPKKLGTPATEKAKSIIDRLKALEAELSEQQQKQLSLQTGVSHIQRQQKDEHLRSRRPLSHFTAPMTGGELQQEYTPRLLSTPAGKKAPLVLPMSRPGDIGFGLSSAGMSGLSALKALAQRPLTSRSTVYRKDFQNTVPQSAPRSFSSSFSVPGGDVFQTPRTVGEMYRQEYAPMWTDG